MGGDNSSENLVLLHPIDHGIAHLVRYKMFGDVRDKWASNWIQKIVDPQVYTEYSIDREKRINEKRQSDPNFDAYMKSVRSNATKNRKEGYQKEVGQAFRQRFASDANYAKPISENRKKANRASVEARNKISFEKAQMVLKLKSEGKKYSEIKNAINVSMGFISKVVNQGDKNAAFS
jgi:hypothetical protein